MAQSKRTKLSERLSWCIVALVCDVLVRIAGEGYLKKMPEWGVANDTIALQKTVLNTLTLGATCIILAVIGVTSLRIYLMAGRHPGPQKSRRK